MKRYIYKMMCVLVLLGAVSCEDELLNIDNPNTLTEGQFWKTESDAQKGINSVYHMFYQPGGFSRWVSFRLDLTSDEGYSISPWVELADWTRFQYVNYNFWEGNSNTWRDFYKAIFRTNQVLDYVPNIEFADQSKKDLILAQAHFLRGFYYYYAAILWENVPLVLKASKPDDLPEQQQLADVWRQVEEDLTQAAQVLPVQWDNANVGRPTKGAAMAFLAKAHMQQRDWASAKTALDYFFTGEGKDQYDLIADYEENFRHTNENNIESVFEIQFSDANKTGEGNGPNSNMGNNRGQFFAPRGIGWSDGQARTWIIDEFKSERTLDGKLDERLRYTLFYPQLEADFGDKVFGRSWEWGANEAFFRKYERDYYRNNEDYYSQVNVRLVRYADILLLYAEVLNELGQTALAYPHVDRVRARVNLRPLALAYPLIGLDKDAFRERLKMERAKELFSESVRWPDLKRWGDLETDAKVDAVAQRDPDFNNFEVGKHIRLPLPANEVLNNPNLKQNPNY
ncbi:MAG: RagB/SusD family nutrient uptake outer membrane protein [Adhaeribacter sp.]